MALHFDIRVNGERIGEVVIQRQGRLKPNTPSRYWVNVEYPIGHHVETEVDHLYTDGAVALIVKALYQFMEEDQVTNDAARGHGDTTVPT